MTRIKTLALATVAATGLVATGANAAPAGQSADAKVKVLKPLTITKSTDLDFGTVVPSTTATGTVVVNAGSAAANCSTGLTCTKTASSASFAVKGSKNALISVTYPTTVSLTQTAGTGTGAGTGAPMLVTFTAKPASPALDTKGDFSFAVGGSLAVAADQADGNYSAPFNVTVDYN